MVPAGADAGGPVAASSDARATPEAGPATRLFTFVGTILVIIALAVLPLLTPFFIHPALDAAGSAARLGIVASDAHALSDRSVSELVVGPGSFAFDGPDGDPFYDASEREHLRDARLLLWVFLVLGLISVVAIALAMVRSGPSMRRSLWHTVSHAGAATAITVIVLGVVSLVAFGTLFTLFHQVFFPAGNWAFDPTTQRLVQLYPFGFWQIAAAALGALVFVLACVSWWLGRTLAREVNGIESQARLGSPDA